MRHRAWLLTLLLCVSVVLLGWQGPDLPAQTYRAWLAGDRHWLWSNQWYGGHPLLGYSLLAPPLGAVVGVTLAGTLSAVLATVAFRAVVERTRPESGRLATWWFALGAAVGFAVGRHAFALGLALGLLALAAALDSGSKRALSLAFLCPLGSPLAGLLLVLAAVAWLPEGRRRACWLLGGTLAGLLLMLPFAGGGEFPFPTGTVLACLLAGVAVLAGAGGEKTVRRGAALFVGLTLGLALVPTAVGGNLVRAASLLAGPVLALSARGTRRVVTAVAGLPLLALLLLPVGSAVTGHGAPSSRPAYYAGLVAFLKSRPQPLRVEVPFTRDHWEADLLARHVLLARGWERQLDVARNRLGVPGVARRHRRRLRRVARRAARRVRGDGGGAAAQPARLPPAGVPGRALAGVGRARVPRPGCGAGPAPQRRRR